MIYSATHTKRVNVAKVTLIIEDVKQPDGTDGLVIDWNSEADYEEGSLAHEYAAGFIKAVMENANESSIVDTLERDGTHKASEEDPGLN